MLDVEKERYQSGRMVRCGPVSRCRILQCSFALDSVVQSIPITFLCSRSPLVGLMLDRYLPRKAAITITAILVVSAIPFAVSNRTRSLIPWNRVENVYHPRAYQYFLDGHTDIAAANIAAADFVNRLPCDQIAIDTYLKNPVLALTPRSMYLYPMLALIHGDGGRRTVWYSGVQNNTVRFNSVKTPCAVICFDCANVARKWAEYRNVGARASTFDYIVVFSRYGNVSNIGGE